MPRTLFDKVVIVGVGLIGSSIGLNLVKKKLAREVIGIGRNQANLREALRRRAIHSYSVHSIPKNLSKNDLVILATPVKEIVRYLSLLAKEELGEASPLITDVGSTKSSIIKEAERLNLRFVGSHPIAGTEKTGAISGEMDLFLKKKCLVIPTRFSSRSDVVKIYKLWKSLGSEVSALKAKRHDEIFGIVSHLPHVLAYSLSSLVGKLLPVRDFSFIFTSLKDMIRVAASSPSMWRDIFFENRDVVLKLMERYENEIGKLKVLIGKNDAQGVFRFLKRAQQIRLKFSK